MARLEVTTGNRAGLVFPLSGPLVTIGRGAECHLRIDPEAELQVSARHAALRRTADGWAIVDLGSRNGTSVNDEPVLTERTLRDGDRIVLGGETTVVYRDGPPAEAAAASGRRHSLLPRIIAGVAIVALLAAVAAFLVMNRAGQRSWASERTRMQQRLDSLQHASESTEEGLRGQVSGLAEALRTSRQEVEALRVDLSHAPARGDDERTAGLRQRLQAATVALRRQEMAASLDFHAIQKANAPAVAQLYVEYPDGRVATATAFAVRDDGTLITNRHVVFGSTSREPPKRIAVQFSDSRQVWPARLLGVAPDVDLAAVKVDNIIGPVPAVRELNLRVDSIARGSAVALIGFPLGGEEPGQAGAGARGTLIRPVVAAGILREVSSDGLKIQGYGAAGASGSPIFDATGAVVGVLYGGREESATQVLYAVPATAVARLLAGVEGAASP